ncbi:MAG TPA: TonB-dependent receptor [Acidobacteriaceae bacterium]|nr:TonB-dependent receptor [Acidobacteriaceae bacterium]
MYRFISRYTRSLGVTLALSCLMLTFIFAMSANAQSTASLNGTVKDSDGAVIPGATITLTNGNTGVVQTKVSSGAGVYSFVNVPPGNYTLQATRDGFKTVLQPEFRLQVNQASTINFTLQVGSATSKVVVSAQGIELQTSTADLGAVVGTKQILDLPLNGRNFTELLLLTPGASPANPLQNSGGAPGAIGSFVYPAINGQSNRSNLFLLDGVTNYGAAGDTNAVQPTIDDILEFKVQSHNDEAEYGQVVGGIVALVTKSGANAYHGDAWEFFRNDGLDASNFFNAQKTPLKQNQFGGSVGGPVLLPHYDGHGRTFFYGSYEGFRQSTSSPSLYLVPTAAQLSGDFTAISSQIYNPYSAHADPNNPGSYLNSPFMCDSGGNPLPTNANGTQAAGTACNKIPSSLFNSTMAYYLKTLFPAPKDVGNPNFNGQDNSPTTINSNQMSARIDEQLGRNDRIFFRYTASWQSDVAPQGTVEGNESLNDYDTYDLAANWTHTFGNSGVIQVTFGRVKGTNSSIPKTPNPADFLKNTDFAPTFYNHSQVGPLIPTVQLSGYDLYGDFTSTQTNSNIYEYKTDDSKMLGRHLLKFGASLATDNDAFTFNGSVDVFGTLQTSNGSSAMGGDSAASALLGLPTYGELDSIASGLSGGKIFGTYFEDQWKVNDRLTLNLGLRYDFTNWPVEGSASNGSNITGNIDLNNGTYELQNPAPACSATQGAPCIPNGGALPAHVTVSPNGKIFKNTYDNVQPRVGLAYRINDNTVFRAAYGRFYDNWAAVIGFGSNFFESWPNVAYLSGSNLNSPTVVVTANDPLGTGNGPIQPSATPFSQSDGFLDPNLKNPYSDQYNAGFQEQFGQNSIVTINYVGSKNRRELLQLTGNAAVTPGPGNPQLRAPYPYIQAQNGYVQSLGTSNYNALQISSQGRTSHGLTYSLAYTWSKSIDFGCDTYGNDCDVQDPYHWQNDKGVAGWNLTNIFAGSAVYPLPFGRGQHWSTDNRAASAIMSGWQLNGILSLTSGSPYDVQAPYQIANTNNISGVERANVIGNPYAGATKLNPINVNAFALPAPYTFGDMGRNSLRTDWHRDLDLSVFRTFRITGSTSLEFRGEAFNITNTPVFSAPDNQLTDPNFGVVSSTANVEREIQLAAKFYF